MAAMSKAKREALEAAGYKFTTVAEWLGLTPEQEAQVEENVKNLMRDKSKAICHQCHKVVDTVLVENYPFETEDVGIVILNCYCCVKCGTCASIPNSEVHKLESERSES